MSVPDRIAAMHSEVATWRRALHAQPELLYDVHQTAAFVADKLRAFGCDDVVTEIGQTGVVGVIHGRTKAAGKVIGLRADMDALPIEEQTNLPYRSSIPGKMHACGHDGHTAMLLGAAKYLSATRDFSDTVILIFQPAEEGGFGARAMLDDGLVERFDIQEFYGMHNMPGLPVGHFATRPGSAMASYDTIKIEIEGVGGHAARPHIGIDPIVIGSHIVVQTQAIVSRAVDPLKAGLISLCQFHAGSADNVIPQNATLRGTARSLSPEIRDILERRLREIVEGAAKSFGGRATLDYSRDFPVTVNHEAQTEFAITVARSIVGEAAVDADMPPKMGSEDFSFMLEKRPGSLIFVGNGDSAGLHNPAYDFNDGAIPTGIAYWVRLVEKSMPR